MMSQRVLWRQGTRGLVARSGPASFYRKLTPPYSLPGNPVIHAETREGKMKACLVILGLAALLEGAGWRSDFAEARRLEAEGQSGAERAGPIYERLVTGAEALPPLESNALALEFFYAGRYREAEAVYGGCTGRLGSIRSGRSARPHRDRGEPGNVVAG